MSSSLNNNISKLPDEILIEIFGLLLGNKDNSDLLNATLICKRWNQIISQTACLMNKLKLLMTIDKLDRIDERNFKLSRQYRHAKTAKTKDESCHYGHQKNLIVLRELALELNQLNSLEFDHIVIYPETIKMLSDFIYLRTLILASCEPRMDGRHDVCKLTSLRNLEIRHTPTALLSHIECNQLDSFKTKRAFKYNERNVGLNLFHFLNQLDRCDEIDINIYNWNFDAKLQLKFLWSKLKLHCSANDCCYAPFCVLNSAAVLGIEMLCKASKGNAESEITFYKLPIHYDSLWIAILNNCKGIKSLELSAQNMPIIPMHHNSIRILPGVQRIQIDAAGLGDESFVNLTRKLPNVTSLIISLCSGRVKIASESDLLLLNSFFDHITEMHLPQYCFEQTSLRHQEPSHFLRINIENLKKLTIEVAESLGSYPGHYYNVKNFCEQNRNVHHIDVEVNRQLLPYRKDKFLIDWYRELRETPVKTCNIMIPILQMTGFSLSLMNWRETEMSEMELFGKVLDEEENRFFV